MIADGDSSSQRDVSERHYVGNKTLIRSDSDLDILVEPPRQRIWLLNSKYCCAGLYKRPIVKSYAKIVGVGVAMTVSYVIVVLIIVYSMGD